MLRVHKPKSKRGVRVKINHSGRHNHDVKEVFVGFQTVTALIGFTVGSVFVGRSLWEYSYVNLGLPKTILIGLAIFIASGVVLGRFHRT